MVSLINFTSEDLRKGSELLSSQMIGGGGETENGGNKMSDILIKGMKMPTYDGVYPCRLIIENGVAKLAIDYIITAFRDERKVYPLVPIPTHGRLIDTDAVSLDGGPYEYDEWCKWALDQYQDAPTIIPAEEDIDIYKKFFQNWHEEDET